jgi:predicted nucleotidyltransferase
MMAEILGGSAPPALDELRRRRNELAAIAARHGASNLRVFGSVARGEQRRDSDLDILIDLEPGRSLFDLGGLLMDLEELFGCRVDVGEIAAFRAPARERILSEAVAL